MAICLAFCTCIWSYRGYDAAPQHYTTDSELFIGAQIKYFEKLNTSPSKPLEYSVKVFEFKQMLASHTTFVNGEPSRLKSIADISVLFALL